MTDERRRPASRAPHVTPRETLVLLPGMMCDERLFEPQRAELGALREIVVPRLTGATTIDGLASKVLAAIDAPAFDLAGLSMGGIVAMAMLRQAPHRVRRLALLDTNHLADAPGRSAIRDRQIADVRAGHLRKVIVDEMMPNYLARANCTNGRLLELLLNMALDLGPDAFVDQSLALRDRHDHTEVLRNYRGPSLVLCGEEDALCPPDRHRQIADLLPGSKLRIVPGAGHITTLEQPVAVNAALAEWLSTNE